MRIKTAIITTVLILGFLFFTNTPLFAQSFESGGGNVNINANIDQDLYSQLDITPSTVEVMEPALVNLHMFNVDGNPMANRAVTVYVTGGATGVVITQPSLSDINGQTSGSIYSSVPGTFEICAIDTTDDIDVHIVDCETIYVVPVNSPLLLSEPPYTKGLDNVLAWTMAGSKTYSYRIQASTSSEFTNIIAESNWISAKTYEFHNLSDGQIYFYRVKARNSFGAESAWSNSVYSVQDNTSPTISVLSLTGLGDNTTKNWEAQDILTFKLRVNDNTSLVDKHFWCVNQDGSSKDCLESESFSGDIWTINVKLRDLEHDPDYYLYPQYNFCAEAFDIVGNVVRTCNILLDVPVTPVSEEPIKPVTPIIEQVKDAFVEIIDDSQHLFQNTIGKINADVAQQISITVAIGNLLIGFGVLIEGFGSLPYVLLQLFLAISSIFGFRKRGQPMGYVYDSITKEPISQCIVRIFNENNVLVWTDVTDKYGYFKSTTLNPGEYNINVVGVNHEFPSKIIFGKTDFPLENIYHGQEFYVSKNGIPNFSIPMDKKDISSVKYMVNRFAFISKFLLKILHLLLFLIGIVFSIYAVAMDNNWLNYLIIILYIPSISLLFSSFLGKQEKYGIVKDTKGNRLPGIILGLKDREFNKLISKRVTDDSGRFRFFVYPGKYDLEILNSDWKIFEGKDLVDIHVKKENVLVRNIAVEKVVPEIKRVKKVKVEEVFQPLEEL
jgi:hypothetical protein